MMMKFDLRSLSMTIIHEFITWKLVQFRLNSERKGRERWKDVCVLYSRPNPKYLPNTSTASFNFGSHDSQSVIISKEKRCCKYNILYFFQDAYLRIVGQLPFASAHYFLVGLLAPPGASPRR